MSNDIDLYQPGGLQPYSPGTDLQPTHDNWGQEVDYSTERQQQYQSSSVQLFGQPIPGATPEQAQHVLSEISAVVASDLLRLGDSPHLIAAAVDWLQQNAGKAPRQERITHRFNLYQYQSDPGTNNWANHMARAGADQTFIDHVLYLLDQLAEKLGEQQIAISRDQPGMAPTSSAEDWENSLSDSEYNALVDYNNAQKARTADILQAKWKDSYLANIHMVDSYVAGLSAVEKAHLDTYTNTGLHALNDPFIIEQLFLQAIGGGSIPTSGAALQDEIEACHRCMREQPKKWRADERLQSRYRHLLDLQRGR